MEKFLKTMKKIQITILFIFLIYEFLPNYYVMAERDGNFQEGRAIQEKGKSQEEQKQQEEMKRLEELKRREIQKRLQEWKAREAQRQFEQWKVREAQKRLEEQKAREERKNLEEWKMRNGWKGERYPYGGYYHNPREGKYGQRRTIRTEAEARKMLLNYFSPQKATIGAIREKGWFFEAEIKDRHNIPIDRVIIDKRTGRIRSIY
jgi:hypothetical protein